MSVQRRVIKGIERGLDGLGLSAALRFLRRHQTIILAFHNVIPSDAPWTGERVLHLPLHEFELFIDDLALTHDFAELDSIDEPSSGVRPRAIITFDDAYLGAVTLGVEALRTRRIPATIFVAPGILGSGDCWWDALAHPSQGLDPAIRDHALHQLRGDSRAALAEFSRSAGIPHETYRIASHAELAAAAASHPGLTYAPHSWTHRNLTLLTPRELTEELARPLDWLNAHFSCTRPYLAYPYGQTNAVVAQATAAAGYRFGFRADYGWLRSSDAPYQIRRFTVGAGTSLEGFRLRAAGLSPR